MWSIDFSDEISIEIIEFQLKFVGKLMIRFAKNFFLLKSEGVMRLGRVQDAYNCLQTGSSKIL
ncbi:hypothetical protein W822_18740 [Advenella kashmirensis W13003]|uniref:Uncharacterized protein n=1 Tax=Advenella kashmirensis W13003 TaxID=1424334 RepID=V8QPZ2_9BURK|nr:hypothetical protein W822_18740 [Advenella kashmirensis W13003]